MLSNNPQLDPFHPDPFHPDPFHPDPFHPDPFHPDPFARHYPYATDRSKTSGSHQVVLRSLKTFEVLSEIDLAWMLIATATGSMREMNPIGNHFLANPIQLVVFKVIAVSVTITLLYLKHRRPIAQVVSWWGCLVRMLLSAGWLTFQSMFIGGDSRESSRR